MRSAEQPKHKPIRLKRYVWAMGIAWTAVVGLSLAWASHQEWQQAEESAFIEARATLAKDEVYRDWSLAHGGVYVATTDEVQPNEKLAHVPDRDAQTPSGRTLTLVTPAEMMRQAHATGWKLHRHRGHITSLDPMNSSNQPDEWEREALRAFESGEELHAGVSTIDGAPHMRLMLPLITREPCLSCHAEQGYKIGQVRGGLGVAVPLARHWASVWNTIAVISGCHLAIWAIGITGLLWAARHLRRRVDQQRKAEAALRESREMFRLALEAIPQYIFWKDVDGRYLGCNQRFAEAAGVEGVQGLIGKTDRDLIWGRDLVTDDYLADDRRVIRTGEPMLGREEPWITAAGDRRIVSTNKVAMHDGNGEIVGVLGAFEDVTEQKFAEDSLAWELRVNGALAELSSMLLSAASIDDISELVLSRAQQLTDSVLGYVGYIDPQTGYLVCPTLTRAAQRDCQMAEKPIVFEQFSGLWGWVIEHGEPILTNTPDDDPRSTGLPAGHVPISRFMSAPAMAGDRVVGQIALANAGREYTERDLEYVRRLASLYSIAIERVRSREALRDSESRHRLLAEYATDMISRVDAEARWFYVSPACRTILGYDPEELIGESAHDYFHCDDQATMRAYADRLMSTPGVHTIEYRIRKKDGSYIWCEANAQAIHDPETGEFREIISVSRDISERHRMLEEQRAQLRFLETLLDTIPSAIFYKHRDGRYAGCNETFAHWLGLPRDHIVGRTVYEISPWALAEKYRAADEQLFQNPGRQVYESQMRCDGDVLRNVLFHKATYTDAAGEVIGLVGIATDVTEIKRSEERLLRIGAAMESASDAVCIAEMGGEVIFHNRAMNELFGYTAEELNELGGVQVLYSHAEEAQAALDQAGDGESWRGDVVMVGRDGRAIDVTVRIDMIRDAEGRPMGLLSTHTDITKRKAAERALMKRRNYETAVTACSQMLLAGDDVDAAIAEAIVLLQRVTTSSRVYIFENFEDAEDGLCMRQTHETCDEGVEAEIDNPVLQHVPYNGGFERWQESLSTGEPIVGLVSSFPQPEREILEPQGIKSMLVIPIWVGGEWFGFIGFDDTRQARNWEIEDVRLLRTASEMMGACIERERARRQLEEGNCMMIETLQREKQVSMRLEATMQQLEASTRDAQASNRAKSEFLANMSHEIRTPMTAILGFAELMNEEVLCCDACNVFDKCETRRRNSEYVGTILSNGQHLLRIINDILDLSKIEAGSMELERIAFAPQELVSAVEKLLNDRARAKSLDLGVVYQTAIPEQVVSDPTRLRQILFNLVGNAIKFTNEGGVRVEIAYQAETGRGWLMVDVVDTGIGISPDQIDRLFQPFGQADSSVTRKYGGTGLGLAISKRLAESLGGTITVESEPGRGSRFRVAVAVTPVEDTRMLSVDELSAPEAISNAAPADSSVTGDALTGVRILLVEDGPDNQRLISFLLKKAGAELTLAANGQEALDIVHAASGEGHAFDVILMDMQMPVLDGYEATRQLRTEGYKGPIVALTAHAMEGDREKCIEAGCDDFATKPIKRAALIETIRKILHARPGVEVENDA